MQARGPAWVLALAVLFGAVALLVLLPRAFATSPYSGSLGGADPRITAMIARVDAERAVEEVARISGEAPLCTQDGSCVRVLNRYTGSEDLAHVLDYLAEQLATLGYEVEREPWANRQYGDVNLIAKATGVLTPTETVYYVAHVDGVASCRDRRCPAADDNGSGVAAGLEIARALAGERFERTLVLMFTTGEEQGSLGAKEHLAGLSKAELEAVHRMVNADMVAWDGDADRVVELYHGDEPRSMAFALEMAQTIRTYEPSLVPVLDPGCG
jgi:acetylornithine deacetylase/succinyl-diaminopimelate desuccinylase-like protein